MESTLAKAHTLVAAAFQTIHRVPASTLTGFTRESVTLITFEALVQCPAPAPARLLAAKARVCHSADAPTITTSGVVVDCACGAIETITAPNSTPKNDFMRDMVTDSFPGFSISPGITASRGSARSDSEHRARYLTMSSTQIDILVLAETVCRVTAKRQLLRPSQVWGRKDWR